MYNYVNHWSPSPSFYKPKSIHMILTIYFLILGFLLWQAILSWAHMSFCFCFAFVSEWMWRRRRKRSWIYFPSPSALSFFGVLRLLCQDQLGWFVFVFRLWIFFSNMVIEFGLELEKKVETYLADFRGVNRKGIQADAAKALYNFHFHGITIYVFSQQTPTYSPTLRQPPFLQDVPILISSPSSSRETKKWRPQFEEHLKKCIHSYDDSSPPCHLLLRCHIVSDAGEDNFPVAIH